MGHGFEKWWGFFLIIIQLIFLTRLFRLLVLVALVGLTAKNSLYVMRIRSSNWLLAITIVTPLFSTESISQREKEKRCEQDSNPNTIKKLCSNNKAPTPQKIHSFQMSIIYIHNIIIRYTHYIIILHTSWHLSKYVGLQALINYCGSHSFQFMMKSQESLALQTWKHLVF